MQKMNKNSIDTLASAAMWYKNLKQTSNEAFFDFYNNESRYLVLMGGGGSGKSIFAGRKILERITSEDKHRVLVCRKVARTLKESCFAQLIAQIGDHYNMSDFTINKSDYVIKKARMFLHLR